MNLLRGVFFAVLIEATFAAAVVAVLKFAAAS